MTPRREKADRGRFATSTVLRALLDRSCTQMPSSRTGTLAAIARLNPRTASRPQINSEGVPYHESSNQDCVVGVCVAIRLLAFAEYGACQGARSVRRRLPNGGLPVRVQTSSRLHDGLHDYFGRTSLLRKDLHHVQLGLYRDRHDFLHQNAQRLLRERVRQH